MSGIKESGCANEIYLYFLSKASTFCKTQTPPSAGRLLFMDMVELESTRYSYRSRKSEYMERKVAFGIMGFFRSVCKGGQ